MDTSAKIAVGIFVFSALSELLALYMAMRISSKVKKRLVDFRALNPGGNSGGNYKQLAVVNAIVEEVLDNQTVAWWAAVLFGLGIILSVVGNLLTLE